MSSLLRTAQLDETSGSVSVAAGAFVRFLFDVIKCIAQQHASSPSTFTPFMTQQFAQMMQYTYVFLLQCRHNAKSSIFAAAQSHVSSNIEEINVLVLRTK